MYLRECCAKFLQIVYSSVCTVYIVIFVVRFKAKSSVLYVCIIYVFGGWGARATLAVFPDRAFREPRVCISESRLPLRHSDLCPSRRGRRHD